MKLTWQLVYFWPRDFRSRSLKLQNCCCSCSCCCCCSYSCCCSCCCSSAGDFAQIKEIRCIIHLHEKSLTNSYETHLIVNHEKRLITSYVKSLITNNKTSLITNSVDTNCKASLAVIHWKAFLVLFNRQKITWSMHGKMKKRPGPMAPPRLTRPKRKMTARSYSWENQD